jgi:hypothetical protein
MRFGGLVVWWFGGLVIRWESAASESQNLHHSISRFFKERGAFQKLPRIVAASKVFVVESELFIKASICAVVPVDGARELVLSVFAVNSDNWVGSGLEFNLIVVDHHSDDARPEGLQVVPPS